MTNAICLAAGLGSRFGHMTEHDHKALLPINGIPNIERTITYLHEFGVRDITIITGHMAELFQYLPKQYGVSLIHNPYYQKYNSIYSMYLALNRLGDTFVIDADVILAKNVFTSHQQSTYYTISRNEKGIEWVPELTNHRVTRMKVEDAREPSLLGISYWTNEDAAVIKNVYPKFMAEKILLNKSGYWDDIPITLYDRIYVTTHHVANNAAIEIDTPEQYVKACLLFGK